MTDLSGVWTLADAGGRRGGADAGAGRRAFRAARRRAHPRPLPRAQRIRRCAGWRTATGLLTRSFDLGRRRPAPAGARRARHRGRGAAERRRAVLEAATSFREHVAAVETRRRREPHRDRAALEHPRGERAAGARSRSPCPSSAGNCPIPNGNMLRKPQCDFGWDWNIAIAPARALRPRSRWSGRRARSPGRRSRSVTGRQPVTLDVERAAARLRGRASRLAHRHRRRRGRRARRSRAPGAVAARLVLPDPALWWPAGLGAAAAARRCAITVGEQSPDASASRCATSALVSEPDAAGRSFGLRVNGRDVFARGANWIPADALPGRITRGETRALLRSAADANMNMIRVWGGGRYEPASFYEACDALGLLVWQDFMFACHLYPSTEDFLAEVDARGRVPGRRASATTSRSGAATTSCSAR